MSSEVVKLEDSRREEGASGGRTNAFGSKVPQGEKISDV